MGGLVTVSNSILTR